MLGPANLSFVLCVVFEHVYFIVISVFDKIRVCKQNFYYSSAFMTGRAHYSHLIERLCCFLAHLIQRLIGELIGYSWSGVRPWSVVNNFKHLLLQNRLPDQSQILCGASLGRGNESVFAHLGHMTKMVATPIYGKYPQSMF